MMVPVDDIETKTQNKIAQETIEDKDEMVELEDDGEFYLDAAELRDSRSMALTRLIVAVLTILNMVFVSLGWQPLGIDGETIYTAISGIASVIAIVWAWWKNNNITKEAQYGQVVIDELKSIL